MNDENSTPIWWHPLWEFGIHVFVGTAIFIIIFAPAVGLNLLVHWLEKQEVSPFLVYFVVGGEILLLIADSVLFVIFLIKTTYRACKKL